MVIPSSNWGLLYTITDCWMAASIEPSPLFLEGNGDVVLRSSDGQEFSVVKAILTIASPFFNSLFSLPQPHDQSDVPRIDVSEDSKTLDVLLRLCYPIKNPIVEDLGLAASVLSAALKYEMEVAIQGMCRVLVSDNALEMQPVRVYCICCRYRLEEEARLAAIASLRAPIEDVYVDELETLPAVYYFRLLQFHRQVRDTVRAALNNAAGIQRYPAAESRKETMAVPSCSNSSMYGYSVCNTGAANWWKEYVSARLLPGIATAPLSPSLFSLKDMDFALEKARECPSCKTMAAAQWPGAVEPVRALINKTAFAAFVLSVSQAAAKILIL